MPDLLLELFSEEIPARMQRQAAEDLKRLVTGALAEADLLYEGAQSFATPRRLTLHVVGVPVEQKDRIEEKKGPRVGAPDAAIQGFLKGAGLARIEDAKIESDGKKGQYYVAHIAKKGRSAREVIAEALPGILRGFPWPKSMRWGAASARSDSLRWVRPLRAIVCTFGTEHEACEVLPFALGDLHSSDVTYGHRFMAPAPIKVRRFDDYVAALFKAKVVLDADRRKQMILADSRSLALAQGLELVEDEGLLEEVAGLVEWPVVLMGEFDKEFLDIPGEAIRATIRANQKCFVLREPSPVMAGLVPAIHVAPLGTKSQSETQRPDVDGRDTGRSEGRPSFGQATPGHDGKGKLSNKFILVANIEASDGGAQIAAGNGRVVRARLSDARHFWRTDQAALPDFADASPKPLDQRLAKLRKLAIVFHAKLGTQGERVERIAALARELAPKVGANPDLASRAATLAKADLVTEMVGEFPELQGLMGRYYATAQGEAPEVAAAIEEHYKPQGPGDRVPTAPVSIAVALADKLDTLVGFWAIDEKPTGSKDPFALRRAALGVVRVVLENQLRIALRTMLIVAQKPHSAAQLIAQARSERPSSQVVITSPELQTKFEASSVNQVADLLAFFADRLKVYLRDRGARHDLIDAVFALPGQDDLLLIVRRVEALGKLLDTDDGKNLLAGYRRAANILKAEEKKEGAFDGAYDSALLELPQEMALAAALQTAAAQSQAALEREDFEGATRALAGLRAPVDAFFLDVTVNADDAKLRVNRLRLLSALRTAMHAIADFSKVAG